MKPKEKAKELINKYNSIRLGSRESGEPYYIGTDGNDLPKQCALIAVDEILATNPQKIQYIGDRFDPLLYEKIYINNTNYWQQVKKEIEAL